MYGGDRVRAAWARLPRWMRGVAGAVVGGGAAALAGLAWADAWQASLPGDCSLGCLIVLPLLGGVLLAGIAVGAWTTAAAPQGYATGWVALILLFVSWLVFPGMVVLPLRLPWETFPDASGLALLVIASAAQVVAVFWLAMVSARLVLRSRARLGR